MLPKALTFSRYRAFSDEVRIELSALNIIIGKNGGGKSVISRLPLLIAGGLSPSATEPLDLNYGEIQHAARYEDLIHQRSSLPFSLGAAIEQDAQQLEFRTTLRYVFERHKLAIEKFELSENGSAIVTMDLESLDQWVAGTPQYIIRQPNTGDFSSSEIEMSGLFPAAVAGHVGLTAKLADARNHFERCFRHPSYLGPFRSEAGALPRIPRQGVRVLGPRGERALDILGDDSLRGGGELVREVESWFAEVMNGSAVKLDISGGMPRMLVVDALRGVDVDLAETGAGFAQVLPIAVQAFAKRAGKIDGSFVIVEQPELHLHPAAHGGLADLLLDSVAHCAGAAVHICETHSEAVITRIRRRIAEGAVAADHVSIYSVGHQPNYGDAPEAIRRIRLDRLGSPDAWPAGVFDEAFDDLVLLREAASKVEAQPES